MKDFVAPSQIYQFLKYCETSNLERKILDCGAGGLKPPLYIFHQYGYDTHGIEISEDQLRQTEEFFRSHHAITTLKLGDMTQMDYPNQSFSYLYSHNTTVHMTKRDILKALKEFHRVLKTDGLCYVNFLSKDCDTYQTGIEKNPGEFEITEDNEISYFTHFDELELEEEYLLNFKIIYKEKKIINRLINNKSYQSGFYDYILQKI